MFGKRQRSAGDTDREVPIGPDDVPVAIYLNQRMVFDALAALDDGFAQVTAITTSAGRTDAGESAGQAGIGLTNAFAFLGLDFSASRRSSHQSTTGENRNEERTHTPTSLFAKLRREMKGLNLISDPAVTPPHSGAFIEFAARLRRSPVIEALDSFVTFANLVKEFQGVAPTLTGMPDELVKQVTWLRSQMEAPESTVDLIADLGDSVGTTAVLAVKMDYFIDPSLNDIIDGDFRVLGKVTRVIDPNNGSINLLRKARIGAFGGPLIESLNKSFSNMTVPAALGDFPKGLPVLIPGPAMQVIPLAIYA